MTRAEQTWAYIERLLTEECGLRPDEGLQGQRANIINAIKNGYPDPTVVNAAAELLRKPAIHRIKIGGKGDGKTREQVADLLLIP